MMRFAMLQKTSLRAADTAFQDELVRLLPELKGYVLSLCGNMSMTEDVVQDTVERALMCKDSFKHGNIGGWLKHVARNRFIDLVRQGRVRLADPIDDEAIHALIDYSSYSSDQIALRMDLRAAFSSLSDSHFDILALRFIDGMKRKDLAELLGIPQGTVASREGRAREALMRELEPEDPDPRF